MWQGEILAGIAGICGGAVVAVALAAFIIELEIIPRFAGITHTADHIFLYENCLMLGSFLEIWFIFIICLFLLGKFLQVLQDFSLEFF